MVSSRVKSVFLLFAILQLSIPEPDCQVIVKDSEKKGFDNKQS
jgi:hypothetical protein